MYLLIVSESEGTTTRANIFRLLGISEIFSSIIRESVNVYNIHKKAMSCHP
jgi:hypothetical protein